MKRCKYNFLKRDFDAWGYNIYWPQEKSFLPLFGFVSLTVEDIKFAYNAWCLLRLAMFYGTEHPKILSKLVNCTPSMDISYGGNRLFYMHAEVEAKLSRNNIKVALTPSHPKAQILQSFPWREVVLEKQYQLQNNHEGNEIDGVEIVLGMENGLSEEIIEQCDYCLYIPQYGSIGSLSMISAMAIAVHSSLCSYHYNECENKLSFNPSFPLPSYGHMPLSNGNVIKVQDKPLPHEKDLLHFSNKEISEILKIRRFSYQLQLSIMVYNEFGDRNIGAIMRNANVFNCEKMVILNRKKFSRRGAVGTQHILETNFYSDMNDINYKSCIKGYNIWLLYQYYPYLKIYGNSTNIEDDITFIRHENVFLQKWISSGHFMNKSHPMIFEGNGNHLIGNEVYLDDFNSVRNAVHSTVKDGYRGIMLVIPEEGVSPHPDIIKNAQRIVYLIHPNRLANEVQRGLNAALSSAIALERLRTAIDTL